MKGCIACGALACACSLVLAVALVTGVLGGSSAQIALAFATCALCIAAVVFAVLALRGAHDEALEEQGDRRGGVRPTSLTALMDQCSKIASDYNLSPREAEVLEYLARGRNAQHISEELVVSEHTVKSHIYRIYKKLDVHNAQELIDYIERYEG